MSSCGGQSRTAVYFLMLFWTYPFKRTTEKPNLVTVNFRSAKEIVFILQKVLQMAFQNVSSIDWTIYELLWAIECIGQLFSA